MIDNSNVEDIQAALAAPFPAEEIGYKPKVVSGNRALPVFFINARAVQDRLDEVMGVANWTTDMTVLPDGCVVCKLSLRINGEWIHKTDVGSPSEQPDVGDRLKAATSDSLKRAAVQAGISRYLYHLKPSWCDYNPQERKFVKPPPLPAWALPVAERQQPAATTPVVPATPPPPTPPPVPARATQVPAQPPANAPKNMVEFLDRLLAADATMVQNGYCRANDLVNAIKAAGKKHGLADAIVSWPYDKIGVYVNTVKEVMSAMEKSHKEQNKASVA